MPSETRDDWTEELELNAKANPRRVASHKNSVMPPYQFKWGEVASEYDAKGVSSEIIVVYDR